MKSVGRTGSKKLLATLAALAAAEDDGEENGSSLSNGSRHGEESSRAPFGLGGGSLRIVRKGSMRVKSSGALPPGPGGSTVEESTDPAVVERNLRQPPSMSPGWREGREKPILD